MNWSQIGMKAADQLISTGPTVVVLVAIIAVFGVVAWRFLTRLLWPFATSRVDQTLKIVRESVEERKVERETDTRNMQRILSTHESGITQLSESIRKHGDAVLAKLEVVHEKASDVHDLVTDAARAVKQLADDHRRRGVA